MAAPSASAGTFRFPSTSQRTAIIGRTGSGKTQLGAWVLSEAPFDVQPYIVVDYKRDELIGSIGRAVEIDLKTVPKKPGLYVVRPNPADDEAVENWLWKIWAHEHIGLYIDEGYMLPMPAKGAFTSILTQGRSKRIPVICLSQRPVFLSRFVFSEADFFAVFRLNDTEDEKTVQRYIRREHIDLRNQLLHLPRYHSYWYDVAESTAFHMQPVPEAPKILERFDERLRPKRKGI
jgi:hypothetical protein